MLVLANVEQGNQVGVLQVQALRDAAKFNIEVAADQLQRDLFASIAHGIIDLAETAVADPALDRIAIQRAGAAGEGEAGRAGGGGRVGSGLRHGEVHGFGFHRFQRNHCLIPVQSAVCLLRCGRRVPFGCDRATASTVRSPEQPLGAGDLRSNRVARSGDRPQRATTRRKRRGELCPSAFL